MEYDRAERSSLHGDGSCIGKELTWDWRFWFLLWPFNVAKRDELKSPLCSHTRSQKRPQTWASDLERSTSQPPGNLNPISHLPRHNLLPLIIKVLTYPKKTQNLPSSSLNPPPSNPDRTRSQSPLRMSLLEYVNYLLLPYSSKDMMLR